MSYSKKCKYECGTEIFWDKAENRFKETLSREYHTQDRCKAFKSGQLTMEKPAEQQQKPVDYVPGDVMAILHIVEKLETKLDQLGQYIKTGFENLQRELQLLAEKYPELKELSELKTENAQLRQVIKEKGLNFEKASEIKPQIDPEKVEERITEYKEVERGNED